MRKLGRDIYEEMRECLKQKCAELWRIFSSDKTVLVNRKNGFYTSRMPKIGGTFVLSDSKLFFQKFKIKIKNFKHIVVNVLSFTYPMDHSQVDLIWPDSTLQYPNFSSASLEILHSCQLFWCEFHCGCFAKVTEETRRHA